MKNKELMDKLRQNKFCKNNGMLLKAIHMLHQYISLSELQDALASSITAPEFLDSVNYLTEGEFIRTRQIQTKKEITLADCPLHELEAKTTQKGIQIISCACSDACIDV